MREVTGYRPVTRSQPISPTDDSVRRIELIKITMVSLRAALRVAEVEWGDTTF
jgi:hypothetical protein